MTCCFVDVVAFVGIVVLGFVIFGVVFVLLILFLFFVVVVAAFFLAANVLLLRCCCDLAICITA